VLPSTTPRPTTPPRSPLRGKIVAWFLIPALIISLAVALLTFYAYRRVTEDLVLARNRDHTALLATQLGVKLTEYAQTLSALDSAGRLAAEPLEEIWYANLLLFDGGMLLLDPAGQVVDCAPQRPALVGTRAPALLPTAREARYSDIMDDLLPSLNVIALSWPISNPENAREGVLVGVFRAERGATRSSRFYQDIWGLYIGRREEAYLVDGQGRVIFHPDTFLIGDDFSALEPVQRVLHGETGAIRTRNREGREVVAGYAPVAGTFWGLVTEESWGDLIQISQPYTRFLLALLVLGVLVPAGVAALGARRITEPLTRLTEAARRIAGGRFDRPIEVHTGDEVEMLAGQFNAMATELQASYATLEQRVADRTRELATLNEIAAVVSRSLELSAVLEAALLATLDALGMEAGAAFRLEAHDTLALMAHRGLSPAFVRQVALMPLVYSLSARAVDDRAPHVRAVGAYPDGALKAALQAEGLRMVVSVPLVAKDVVLGTLNLATRAPREIAPEEMALLAAIGQQTGVAVENARLYEQAEIAAAEAERIRLARDLHDAVSQTLFSASLIADVLPRLWARDPEAGAQRLESLRRLTRGAMAEMRALLMELRPAALLKVDLADLLHQLAEAVSGKTALEVKAEIGPVPPLPEDVKVALYRIAQEALNNVVKHARARRVVIGLAAEEGAVALRIHDDGRGFDPADVPPGHFGLDNIRERAAGIGADIVIDSAPGHGVQITVRWRDNG